MSIILNRLPRLIGATVALLGVFVSCQADAVGPESVANLAAPLLPGVVTISAIQNNQAASADKGPALAEPPSSPFSDLFTGFYGQAGRAAQPTGQSLGSGFVIDPSGIIVTNNHVIDGADQITANFIDGSSAVAQVVGIDDKTDIAVLRVDVGHPLPMVSFGDSATLRVGDWVMAVGNPFGFGGTVTLGIVSARNRDIQSGPYDAFIQTDASINRGNSGGPLFNMDGQVIGINTAIVSPTGGSIGIGFAIPAEIALGVVSQLRQFGHTRRGYLGVRIQPLKPDLAQGAGLTTGGGALIVGVDDPGPGADAGLMAGDIIVSFGGMPLDAEHDLPRIVANEPVGTDVPLVVIRNSAELTLNVRLGQLPDPAQTATSSLGAGGSATAPSVAPPSQSSPGSLAPLGVAGPFGLTLSDLTNAVRTRLGLSSSISSGVPVVGVVQGSVADQKRIQPGDVIIQVEQEAVTTPDGVAMKIDALKMEARMTAQLTIANKDGNIRFVVLTLQ